MEDWEEYRNTTTLWVVLVVAVAPMVMPGALVAVAVTLVELLVTIAAMVVPAAAPTTPAQIRSTKAESTKVTEM